MLFWTGNRHVSKKQGTVEREDRKNKNREERGEREERGGGQAHGTRTGTSGEEVHTDWNIRVAEALDWNIRGGSGQGFECPGLQKEEEATAARNGKENMNDGS